MKKTLLSGGALLIASAIAGAMLLPSAAFAVTYKKQTIMAASANSLTSAHAVTLNKFKEIVEKESAGAIQVKLFLAGSMGDETANVKQLRNEELHIATLFTGNLTPFAPSANVLVLPYLFSSLKEAYAVLENEKFTNMLAEQIVKESKARPLGWMIGGYRSITNNKKPILKMEDLQGIKLRVSPAAIQLATFRAFGIEPHPMAWSETYNALQQGVIDGQENMYATNRDHKFWEIQKYMTEIHYMLWTGTILASDRWFGKLDADTKALVVRAAKQAQKTDWEFAAAYEEECKKESIAKGMRVDYLTDEDKWQQKARAIWPDFVKTPEMKALAENAVAIIGALPKK
jgi:TRAP-type transport system periplasmic protein